MATTRITAVLSALALSTALAAGGGMTAPLVLADPTDTTTAPTPDGFTYQPLWPFASQVEADRWLREGAAAGDAPWHADPETTALLFTQDYLGFTEIDQTTDVTVQGAEASVGVGYTLPNGSRATVSTIHLARFGSHPDAPWEVVGARDDALTLETPRYGSAVGPVIEAGGSITGVDESLHLQIRQSTQAGVLGDHCCVPAGGEDRPWSARFTMTTPPQPGALTLVVSTGGHVADVELFVVTGLRAE